ncbi:hypothetical protein ANANG_G00131120 [Anguilla anguilla]|uniref:Homeobox domain-containing protein n=1 Tax=Anguilla anguilla TaxID=7936 RepID=A0A9D3MIJ8_ANGAN|nr:hypothetical protein ANANG_G00131120 [Anguilla anguilla]
MDLLQITQPNRELQQLLLLPPHETQSAPCKRKEQEQHKDRSLAPKKQRLVFTDLQRRTLIAIFKENKRPSKEMQHTISQQLGLELSTVSNFFMNARRRWPTAGTTSTATPTATAPAPASRAPPPPPSPRPEGRGGDGSGGVGVGLGWVGWAMP